MKKILTLVLAGIMIFTFSACDDKKVEEEIIGEDFIDIFSETEKPPVEPVPKVSHNGFQYEKKDVLQNGLTNPNATDEAKLLYDYINEIYKNGILTGQQESTWMSEGTEYEMDYILEKTGKLPAIRGLDYINNDYDGVTERAIDWWERGGIVSICWHWGVPPSGVGYNSSKDESNYIRKTDGFWDDLLTEGTELNTGMLKSMDRVANELLELQEAGVPVLWRPFHEFDGTWFWWGKGGNERFIELWQYMYDRYTNHFGLNNLIWVLGYSHEVRDNWYPGDNFVDICGADSYDTGVHQRLYQKVERIWGSEKPICLHENGELFSIEEMLEKNVHWTWFLTWHTEHITEDNTAEHLNYIYNHDYAITIDELPDFKSLLN